MKPFRTLRADEIDCRIAQVKQNGISLLLYKDARCDMNILDETVNPENWQRSHSRDNANCTVSIWDDEKKQWISKEDTGTESFTEKEKGLASDSFKRACFNWGIGRELYTAPFIWIVPPNCTINEKEDKKGFTCYDSFYVSHIEYDKNKVITALQIKNSKTHKVVYELGKTHQQINETGVNHVVTAKRNTIIAICTKHGLDAPMVCAANNCDWNNMSEMQLDNMISSLKKKFGDS